MSFWGTLGKMAGFGAAPVTGGASLLVPALIGAGTSIAGGIIGAKAAGKASKQQQEAVAQARAEQARLYQQAQQIAQQQLQQGQAGLAPYAAQGQQGLTALSALMGFPAASTGGAPPPMAPGAILPAGAMGGRTMPPGGTPTGFAVPRGAAPGMSGGMILLRAPTGQTRAVPADQVDYYLARGATRG